MDFGIGTQLGMDIAKISQRVFFYFFGPELLLCTDSLEYLRYCCSASVRQ